jgi:hypothetical protein
MRRGEKLCNGFPGVPCANKAMSGHEHCMSCNLTASIMRRTGRPLLKCERCSEHFVGWPTKAAVCLTCQEIEAFGEDLALVSPTPARDTLMAALLLALEQGTISRDAAAQQLRDYDARR